LSVPDLHQQNNKWIAVNVSAEWCLVVLVVPVKQSGRTDRLMGVLLQFGHKPFQVIAVLDVQDSAVEKLEAFTGWVVDDLFVLGEGLCFLGLCLFHGFFHSLNVRPENFIDFSLEVSNFSFFLSDV
jgi:hypothetical protein